jgi:hypothetical protein
VLVKSIVDANILPGDRQKPVGLGTLPAKRRMAIINPQPSKTASSGGRSLAHRRTQGVGREEILSRQYASQDESPTNVYP